MSCWYRRWSALEEGIPVCSQSPQNSHCLCTMQPPWVPPWPQPSFWGLSSFPRSPRSFPSRASEASLVASLRNIKCLLSEVFRALWVARSQAANDGAHPDGWEEQNTYIKFTFPHRQHMPTHMHTCASEGYKIGMAELPGHGKRKI